MTADYGIMDNRLIEDLAYKLKFGNLSRTQNEITMLRFTTELLKYKNLNRYIPKSLEHVDSLLMQTENETKYDGEIFTKALQSALAAYGKKDVETGELIPFLKIFNSHYGIKEKGIKPAAFNELRADSKIKSGRINDLLVKIANAHGMSFERNRFNVLNRKNLEKKLADLKASDDERNEVFYVLDNTYITKDAVADGETGEDSDAYISDEMAYKQAELSDYAAQLISDAFERGFTCCKTRTERKWFKCIAAFKFLNILGDNMLFVLEKYMDKGFVHYYLQTVNPKVREIEILAAYMQVETETARKKIKKFEKTMLALKAL